jgi:hypothetical protein
MEVATRSKTSAGVNCRLWTRTDPTSWTTMNIFWFPPREKVSSGSRSGAFGLNYCHS